MKNKILRVLAGLLGLFILLSGVMLLSPMFNNDLMDRVNGVAFFIFSFFILRYALKGNINSNGQ